jgi:hypothetical protein
MDTRPDGGRTHVRTVGELARGCGAAGHEHGGREEACYKGIAAFRKARWRVVVWVDEGRTEGGREAQVDSEALLEAKDETISILRDQLRLRAEEIQRRDVIISQLTQANAALAARVPELEAAREASEGAQEPAEAGVGAANLSNADPGSQEGVQRPWWRRMFGR